jgi:alanine racemase
MNFTDQTWIEIDHKNLIHNFNQFAISTHTGLMPVIKSNAYGHGIIEIAKTLESHSVYKLAVVHIQEALELRANQIKSKILILGFTPPLYYQEASKQEIELTIFNHQQIRDITSQSYQLKIHLKVNTGMNRLGFAPDEIQQITDNLKTHLHIEVQGIMTHFADAETPENPYTKKQLRLFNQATKFLDPEPQDIHTAASAASITFPDSRFTLTRLGISLFGIWPSSETHLLSKHSDKVPSLTLKPVLQWKTQITNIQKIPAAESIGYGCTYTTHQDSVIATIPIGYADGYPRSLSNKAHVLIGGKRAPIVGKICMNMTMIDVTHIPDTNLNDEVILIGSQNQEQITAEELANHADTIAYEILTRINWTIPIKHLR